MDEEVLISGQEVEEYEISEYVEHSRQVADDCGQYTADIHQFVGEDLFLSSNQPYSEGGVCTLGNGIVQTENGSPGVNAGDDNEEEEYEEYNNMLDCSIEDWVNGIDLCEEPPCDGSEVIGEDIPAGEAFVIFVLVRLI